MNLVLMWILYIISILWETIFKFDSKFDLICGHFIFQVVKYLWMDDRMFHITDIELAALNETKRVESEHILQALQDSEESEAVCGSAANSENIDMKRQIVTILLSMIVV